MRMCGIVLMGLLLASCGTENNIKDSFKNFDSFKHDRQNQEIIMGGNQQAIQSHFNQCPMCVWAVDPYSGRNAYDWAYYYGHDNVGAWLNMQYYHYY